MAQSALLNAMVQSITKNGRAMNRTFVEIENLQNSTQDTKIILEDAKKKTVKDLKYNLEKIRKNSGFNSQDDSAVVEKENKWFISTNSAEINFLNSIPFFAVSTALEYNGEFMACVIYNPLSEELFTAERGQGAYCNGKRIRVNKDSGERPIIASELDVKIGYKRSTGCVAIDLAWVAMGRFDGYKGEGLNVYDIAAGMLLIREAGGFVSAGVAGESIFETGKLVAGNQEIHKILCQ